MLVLQKGAWERAFPANLARYARVPLFPLRGSELPRRAQDLSPRAQAHPAPMRAGLPIWRSG